MKKSPIVLMTLILAIGFALWSCEETKNPVGVAPTSKPLFKAAGPQTGGPSQVLSLTDTTLAGFRVTFDSVRFVNNQSTFYYTASIAQAANISFRLEWPPRAGTPSGYSLDNNPNTATGNELCSISPGVTWNPSTPQAIYHFSVTYPGRYNLGSVGVGVKNSSTIGCGTIAGVGVRVYDIAGTVFSDADSNGVKSLSETGITGVTVNLLNSSNFQIGTTTTNSDGGYLFSDKPAGTYTIQVDTSTLSKKDPFFVQSTPTSIQLNNWSADSPGNNFGFAPTYDISGIVFTDADSSGRKDPNEIGIADVTVNLRYNGNSVPATTNANGDYLFQHKLGRLYTIEVDQNTLPSKSYMFPTTPTSILLDLKADTTGNNFGFKPNTKKVIADLQSGTIATAGQPANWWKKQFQSALSGTGNPAYSKPTLVTFLHQINGLALNDPYQFSENDAGLSCVLDLLSRPVKTNCDKLVRELLAAELNWASGRSITLAGTTEPNPKLQVFLLGWGEEVAVSNTCNTSWFCAAPSARLQGATPFATGTSGDLSDAITIFTQLNSSGGGSGSK